MGFIHLQTAYFFFAMVALACGAAMLLAYFSIKKARYYLYWAYYIILLGTALWLPSLQPVFDIIPISAVSNIIVFISAIFLIRGFADFSGNQKISTRKILAGLAVIYCLALLPGYLRPEWTGYREMIVSFMLGASHVISALVLRKDPTIRARTAGRVSDLANLFLAVSWIIRGILSATARTTDINSDDAANFTLVILMTMMIVEFFSMIIISQSRIWRRLVETELAMEGASFRASTSTLFAGIAHDLGSPAGNALMALSLIDEADDNERREELILQAKNNLEGISVKLRNYRRLIGYEEDREEVLHLGELLENLFHLMRRSENLAGIRITLDPVLAEDPMRSPVIKVRPGVLFQGLIAILEVVGRMKWVDIKENTIVIGCGSEETETFYGCFIRISGLNLPGELFEEQRDVNRTKGVIEGKDMLFLDAARISMENLLDARITWEADPETGSMYLLTRLPSK